MIDCETPEPIKSLVFACQAMIHWHDEYASEQYWDALSKENTFRERIRDLLPSCLDLIRNYPEQIDCE